MSHTQNGAEVILRQNMPRQTTATTSALPWRSEPAQYLSLMNQGIRNAGLNPLRAACSECVLCLTPANFP